MSQIDAALPSYGAIVDNGADKDQSFDAENTYYLGQTTRWTFKKMMLVAVPILGAILIVGGFALFLLKDFNHLYPGRGGEKSGYYEHGGEHVVQSSRSSSRTSNSAERSIPMSSPRVDDADDDDERQTTNSKHLAIPPLNDDAGANCAVHPDCKGLIGLCCPTSAGAILDCCKN